MSREKPLPFLAHDTLTSLTPQDITFRSGNATVGVGLKLEEIQISPSPIDCIMNAAFRVATFRTWEFATKFEIYVNVESLPFQVEVD